MCIGQLVSALTSASCQNPVGMVLRLMALKPAGSSSKVRRLAVLCTVKIRRKAASHRIKGLLHAWSWLIWRMEHGVCRQRSWIWRCRRRSVNVVSRHRETGWRCPVRWALWTSHACTSTIAMTDPAGARRSSDDHTKIDFASPTAKGEVAKESSISISCQCTAVLRSGQCNSRNWRKSARVVSAAATKCSCIRRSASSGLGR